MRLFKSFFAVLVSSFIPTIFANTILYSPYKDIGINMNWNTFAVSTQVHHKSEKLLDALLPQNKVVTLAFATGMCGAESWAGVGAKDFQKNIPEFEQKGIGYIIATGGAAGAFNCDSAAHMEAFVKSYASKSFVGLDFDIEGGYNKAQLQQLMHATAGVQKNMPLRVSLTLATLSTEAGTLNPLGIDAINAARAAGLDFYVNLMVMDYGPQGCSAANMGDCAVHAAQYFSKQYNVPLDHIELTPMIGDNDDRSIFTLAHATKVAQFVKAQGLAGLHYWSFDRDTDCPTPSSWAQPTCNAQSKAAFEFNQAFLSGLARN